MTGVCDHCSYAGDVFDAGHGIHLCAICNADERALVPDKPGKFVNQHGRALGRRNEYPGERRGPLSNEDKAHVCILAREAFVAVHEREPAAAELQEWRREEQRKACGLKSLTHCTQTHLPDLEAHFLNLKGQSGRAFQKLMGKGVAEAAVVRAVLARNLGEFGLPEAYAATICRSRCKCELHEASVKQLWNVVFTVRKNQQRKARGRRAAR